ncbi:MAG TPA: M13 family metallopeptidase [Kofleriaceae bacterium]|nr:M13 family metallopeptidase [Kofleriaceae bacterium]
MVTRAARRLYTQEMKAPLPGVSRHFAAVLGLVLRLALGLMFAWGCSSPADPRASRPAAASRDAEGDWLLDRQMLDPAVSPCDDFYQHACGGWLAAASISPGSQSAERVRDLLREATDRVLDDLLEGNQPSDDPEVGRLRTFFAACAAEGPAADGARERTLAGWLARLGEIDTRAQLQVALRELSAAGINAFFAYSGEPDRADRTRYRGQIHQDEPGLGRADLRDRSPAGKSLREAYAAHIARMFELAGIDAARARRDAGQVLALEEAMARVSLSFGDTFDPAASEHPTSIAELSALAPHVDWRAYLAMVGHPPDRPLNVTSPAYLRAMDRLIATRSTGALVATLRWRLLHGLGPAAPRRLADEHVRFSSRGVERPSRREECRTATQLALGVELSRQFSRRAIPEAQRDRARAVADQVRAVVADSVGRASWLSSAARSATAEKIRATDIKVGYPDEWPATGGFPLRTDDHLANVLAARAYEQGRVWSRAGAERRRSSWEMIVYPSGAPGMAAARLTIGNGFPDLLSNSIILTAAMLQPPLFDASAPPEVQLGSFGSLVAHELIHVVDLHQFDATGAQREMWAAGDVEAHTGRRACVVDQASQSVGFEGQHLDGQGTVDENVADLGGVIHAYQAMERAVGARAGQRGADGLTPEQRFFYAHAQRWCVAMRPEYERESMRRDPHAPPRFRVNGPLSNMRELAAAFSCRAGASMVRPAAARCSVW